ncbi:putative spermidine/putrescine transport system substrate-binding protein [Hoeflea halophila]|uniref:Putative spermidine/putrescine transport system substrate-binding protein n=1 Tax=Hoeflea halophila TaxID=714899 RepID=A0A286IFV8_9HYPH|nr:ABC transporter substrate-binding protein [Hoeflea halophila]SOE18962.1 putative spermidine/putrescine transport system substrate-binding protein [Hoeflea halophila]
MKKLLISLSLSVSAIASSAVADEVTDFRDGFLKGEVTWSDVETRAKSEGEVNLYYWGGSDPINIWMDQVVTPALAELGVKFNPVRITGTKDAVDLVLAEKGAGKGLGEGSVDAIWLNGENFATLKRQDALFGAFADKMPNSQFIEWNPEDPRSLLNLRDFGVETNAAEVPWSGEQYVCAVNTSRVDKGNVPGTFAELKTYLEANPGKFTYVKPPHYLGNTFVQAAIYAHNPDGTGGEPFQNSIDELGVEELARLITPGLEYLKSLEPLLLGAQSGSARYPEDNTALDGLFLNGEIDFSCKFGLYAVAVGLSNGTYPEGAEAFVFPEGNMIKNKNYLAIPANAPNPAAALVLANYMTSVDSQVTKLKFTGMPAGVDPWKLSEDDVKALTEASPGLVGVTQAELDANTAPDTNATLVDVIEATWLEYIERDSSDQIETIVQRAADNLSK